jgi:SAM-dependent methyltransferase
MSTITPAALVFAADDAAQRALPCTVCGSSGPHQPRVTVPALDPPHTSLTLLICAACGSGFYDPPGIRDFSDLDLNRSEFWRAYVEAIGGVWETLWPPLAALPHEGASLLDVGCGFGFTVDAWRRVRRADAVGLELAEYGAAGARLLDIPVYREMLEDCAPLAGRLFDVVYASEVVEHVPDPQAFVALLARHVAPGGVLVLTTPCIDYVHRANAAPALLATLAPGFHGFLLSPRAFADMARVAGFAHVEVRTFGERQVLWASMQPLTVDPAPARLRPAYFDYLKGWLAQPDHSSPVWQGFAFRLARDLTNLGHIDEAQPVARALADALVARFGNAVLDPEAMVARAATMTSQSDFGEFAPFFLPAFWYTLGTIAQVSARDAAAAERWYRGSARLTLAATRPGLLYFLEALSLVWPARARVASIAIRDGRFAEAVQEFSLLAREAHAPAAQHGYAVAGSAVIDAEVPRACGELAALERWGDARAVFDAYVAGLAQRFPGFRWDSVAALAAALDAPAETVPADPVFPLFFSVLLDARIAPPPGDLGARVALILAVAQARGATGARDANSARIAWYAREARQRFPALVPAAAAPGVRYDVRVTLPPQR